MRTDLENLLDAIVSDGWAEETTGTTEAPTGHVALVNLTTAGPDLMAKRDELDLSMTDDDLHKMAGWWIVTTTDQGFIYGSRYSERVALDVFRQAEQAYAAWDDLDA